MKLIPETKTEKGSAPLHTDWRIIRQDKHRTQDTLIRCNCHADTDPGAGFRWVKASQLTPSSDRPTTEVYLAP